MGKYFVAVAVSLLFCVATIFAQFSDVVTGMLESPAVTWGEAAYVLACALDEPAEPGDAQAALLLLQERDIAPGGVSVEQGITLAQLSGLCMRTWRLRGGLFYSITGADRYAFRELRAKGILPPGADPSMLVDGFDALNIIHSCMELGEVVE